MTAHLVLPVLLACSPSPTESPSTSADTGRAPTQATVHLDQLSACTPIEVCGDCTLVIDGSGLRTSPDGTTVGPDDVTSVSLLAIARPTSDALAAACADDLGQDDIGAQQLLDLGADHRLTLTEWPTMHTPDQAVAVLSLTLSPPGGAQQMASLLLRADPSASVETLHLR